MFRQWSTMRRPPSQMDKPAGSGSLSSIQDCSCPMPKRATQDGLTTSFLMSNQSFSVPVQFITPPMEMLHTT